MVRRKAYKVRRPRVCFRWKLVLPPLLLIAIIFQHLILSRHTNFDVDQDDVEIVSSMMKSGSVRRDKVFKFYNHGWYDSTEYDCPVEWEWTDDPAEADVSFFDILANGMGVTRSIMEGVLLFEPPFAKITVSMSLESEIYYPQIVNASTVGPFDYSADYRIWNDSGNGLADIPLVYFPNPKSPDAIKLRDPPFLEKRSDAYIAAFISNCRAKNDRDLYLRELMEHMPLHSYGGCRHNIDEPKEFSDKSLSKISIGKEYYFWFVPENSNVPCYVTEKIYHAFAAGVVPVYMGAPNIDRFIPHPSAIIKAADFTPRELARLLNETVSNRKEYMKFFEWKKKPFSEDFKRVYRLASRSAQCRLAMHLAGLDMES